MLPQEFPINEDLQEVSKLSQGGTWNEQLIDQNFPEAIAEHIKHKVQYGC